MLNIAGAADAVGMEKSSAENYLRLLEAVFLIQRLPLHPVGQREDDQDAPPVADPVDDLSAPAVLGVGIRLQREVRVACSRCCKTTDRLTVCEGAPCPSSSPALPVTSAA